MTTPDELAHYRRLARGVAKRLLAALEELGAERVTLDGTHSSYHDVNERMELLSDVRTWSGVAEDLAYLLMCGYDRNIDIARAWGVTHQNVGQRKAIAVQRVTDAGINMETAVDTD